jgi:hypothetical protein
MFGSDKEIWLKAKRNFSVILDTLPVNLCVVRVHAFMARRNPLVAEPRFITSVLDVVSAVSASERGESARNGVAASLSERVLDLCKQCLWTDAHSKLSLHAMALPIKG